MRKRIRLSREIIIKKPGESINSLRSYIMLKLVRVISGNFIWDINGREYTVGPDDIVIFSVFDNRRIRRLFPDDTIGLEVISFYPDAVGSDCLYAFYVRNKGFSNVLKPGAPYYTETVTGFHALFASLGGENPRGGENPLGGENPRGGECGFLYNELISGLLTVLLVYVNYAFGSGEAPDTDDRDYPLLNKALSYIGERYADDISERALAASLGCSASHFSRLFYSMSGIHLPEYIRRLRISMTLEYLDAHDCNVLEGALENGFRSASGFYKAFREVVGSTPRRRNGAKKNV